jgi:ketopantoate reductase
MRIVVVGAGGTGGYFGGILARAGEDVTFIARGAHLEALRARTHGAVKARRNVHYSRAGHGQPTRGRSRRPDRLLRQNITTPRSLRKASVR